MSDRPVRSVLLLCWRDTGHPQGGGSETYLQRIGAQLAASGVRVTLRTARYPGAPRREVVDGVRVSRGGGPYSVYIWAGLAMVRPESVSARCGGSGPTWSSTPRTACRSWPGWPTAAASLVLVHHCHREQWPVAGRLLGRFGWFVESRLSPRLHRRNQYVTVSLPSARDLDRPRRGPEHIAVVRNGLDEAPAAHADRAAVGHAAGGGAVTAGAAQADRGRAGRDRRAALADSGRAPGHPRRRLVGAAAGRPRRAAGHLRRRDVPRPRRRSTPNTHVLQRCWVHVLPSRKEGWGAGGHRGGAARGADHRLPVLGRPDGFDRRRGHRPAGRRPRRTGRRAATAADRPGAARTTRRQGAGAQRRVLVAAERRRDAHGAASRCAPGRSSAASSSAHRTIQAARAAYDRHRPRAETRTATARPAASPQARPGARRARVRAPTPPDGRRPPGTA